MDKSILPSFNILSNKNILNNHCIPQTRRYNNSMQNNTNTNPNTVFYYSKEPIQKLKPELPSKTVNFSENIKVISDEDNVQYLNKDDIIINKLDKILKNIKNINERLNIIDIKINNIDYIKEELL